MRGTCLLVGKAHAAAASQLRPGMTTMELNDLVETFIMDHGGYPSFKNYHGFLRYLHIHECGRCTRFPGKHELKEGDIISLDIGIFKNGFHGDSAYTYALGEVSDAVKKLLPCH